MTVAVGIKALNEEAHIAASIESALAALARVGGGIVYLADSGSSDATVEIAQRYPGVRILQLADPTLRSCGAGAQLAFQTVEAEFFYLLDGDMVLDPEFLEKGVAFLRANPEYAAVGGRVREASVASIEFELRAQINDVKASGVAGDVGQLDCGGLYRVSAIRDVGHFSDRNLHAFEEFDLGVRLRAAGWKLARLDIPGVDHFGHTTGGYRLMLRRVRTGYAGGPGEVMRAALGQPHFKLVLRQFSHFHYAIVVLGWWSALLALALLGQWIGLACVALLPLAFLTWRRGSLRIGLYSLFTWNIVAIGFIQGLCRSRHAPSQPLPAHDLSRGQG